jgi:hypothetical protein
MRYTVVRGFLRHCGVAVEKVIEVSTHKRLDFVYLIWPLLRV